MKHVFISYSRKDLEFIEKLAKDLQRAGYDVWYDLSDLEGGDRWASEIQAGIDQCDVFVTVISPHSMASEWVEKEFLYASSARKNMVPLRYEPVTEAPATPTLALAMIDPREVEMLLVPKE